MKFEPESSYCFGDTSPISSMKNTIYAFYLLTLLVSLNFALCKVHYIMPTQGYQCPVDSCLTLSQFANNVTGYIDSTNTTLFVIGGNYYLNRSITMSDTFNLSIVVNETETPSVFRCSERASFTFSNITSILISGLTFMGCSNSRFDSINQLIIQHSIFDGQAKGNTSVVLTRTSANVTATSFVSNTAGLFF